MTKSSLYLSLFKYSILHPKEGIKIIESVYETILDSKHKLMSEIKPMQVQDCFKCLFPFSKISFDKNERVVALESHMMKFVESIQDKEYPSKEKPYPFDYSVDNRSALFLYALCKIIKPEKIVETGVAYGRSSAYILQALHENQKGKLYSIDYTFRPWQSKQMIGSAIPNYLKDRWELIFGSSKEKLSDLLNSLGTIDIFFHDSLHTFKTMKFEFHESWSHIKQKGYLLSDDAAGNNAFHSFCSSHNLKPLYLLQEIDNSCMGIAQKQ